MTQIRLVTALGIAALAICSLLARPIGVQAAANLYLQQRCEPDGSVSLAFIWEGNDPRASQQWLDVSQVSNGWQPGSFTSVGPLSATTAQYIWPGWRPNTSYYARVNQQLPGGSWDSSITYGVEVQAPSPDADIVHTSAVYFIGPGGTERYLAEPMADHTSSGAAYLPAGRIAASGRGIAQVARTLSS